MDAHQLHVVFFPFPAQGHLIPTLDMAKLFSSRGLKTTVVITTLNAQLLGKAMETTKPFGDHQAAVRVLDFPAAEVCLPKGCSSMDQITTYDMLVEFVNGLYALQEPFQQLLQELSPGCLVSDMFFPWATDVAAKLGIPKLVFHGTSLFTICTTENLRLYKPFKNVSSHDQPFALPHFPHQIEFTKLQVPEYEIDEPHPSMKEMLTQVKESGERSFGVIFNSFYELEKDYLEYLSQVGERRAWLIGPLSLCNREVAEKAQRGKKSSIDIQECLQWLDSRKPNSVIYACFGTVAPLSPSQLHEIALGLEASEQQFIWVISNTDDDRKWLPEGFEERIKDKGLIIKGWAPQVLILEHEATGGFITHCGWNSALEAVCAGVPMLTWPMLADQPFNEKLLTQVLKIGVAIGSPLLNRATSEVKREDIADAVKRIMEGEEAVEIRSRAKALKEMACRSVEEGGSSYNHLSSLIQEIMAYHSKSNNVV